MKKAVFLWIMLGFVANVGLAEKRQVPDPRLRFRTDEFPRQAGLAKTVGLRALRSSLTARLPREVRKHELCSHACSGS